MKTANTVMRANRLLIMLVRELYLAGDIETAISVTGMPASCVELIGVASTAQIDDLVNGVTISMFTPRLTEADLALLLDLPLNLKAAYAITTQKHQRCF